MAKNRKTAERGDERFRVLSPTQSSIEIVGLRAEIKVWFQRPFNEFPWEFLEIWELLAAPLRSELNWYSSYNMARHAKLTERTWTAPRVWVQSEKQDTGRGLYLKAASSPLSNGRACVDFEYLPDGALYSRRNAPYIRWVAPSEWLEDKADEIVRLVRALGEKLPFMSGYAGYAFALSDQKMAESHQAALPLAIRHPGVVIDTHHATWPLKEHGGIETVNWLTLVGEPPLQQLGGEAAVRRALEGTGVEVTTVKHGLILQAGARAAIGDRNRADALPEYRAVYRALRPAIEPIVSEFRPLQLGGDDAIERTESWLRRFEDR